MPCFCICFSAQMSLAFLNDKPETWCFTISVLMEGSNALSVASFKAQAVPSVMLSLEKVL